MNSNGTDLIINGTDTGSQSQTIGYYDWQYPGTSWPYSWGGTVWPYSTTIYTTPILPWCCDGNVHVFGCDHATKCKCGKSTRKVEQPKCAHCGKTHG